MSKGRDFHLKNGLVASVGSLVVGFFVHNRLLLLAFLLLTILWWHFFCRLVWGFNLWNISLALQVCISMLLYHVLLKANCPLKCVYCPVIFCRLSSYFLSIVQLFFVDCPVFFCRLSSYFLSIVQLFLSIVQIFFVDCPVIFCGLSSYFLWTVQLFFVDCPVIVWVNCAMFWYICTLSGLLSGQSPRISGQLSGQPGEPCTATPQAVQL